MVGGKVAQAASAVAESRLNEVIRARELLMSELLSYRTVRSYIVSDDIASATVARQD